MLKRTLLVALIFSGSLFSSEKTPEVADCHSECPEPVCEPCKPYCPPTCEWKFNPCNPKGCSNMAEDTFYLSGEFLYFRADNHGFSYAFELDGAAATQGKMARMDPDWDPGFRVGLGWNTSFDYWDIFFRYTWYRNHTAETNVNNTAGFLPLWPASSSTLSLFGTASASSMIVNNLGDFEIGRLLYLTETLAIRPYCGVRGGTIHQKFKSVLGGTVLNEGANAEQRFRGKNDYWGVGPASGVSSEWHIDSGLSVLGRISGALLYGKTNVTSVTRRTAVGQEHSTVFRSYRDDFFQLAPHLQMALGFQWQACLSCQRMFFKMSAAWEANYFWNQFNIPFAYETALAPFPTVGNQPLTAEGLSLQLELDF